jgi:hypothetical protein
MDQTKTNGVEERYMPCCRVYREPLQRIFSSNCFLVIEGLAIAYGRIRLVLMCWQWHLGLWIWCRVNIADPCALLLFTVNFGGGVYRYGPIRLRAVPLPTKLRWRATRGIIATLSLCIFAARLPDRHAVARLSVTLWKYECCQSDRYCVVSLWRRGAFIGEG